MFYYFLLPSNRKVEVFFVSLHFSPNPILGGMLKVIISFKIDAWIKQALQKLATAENRSLSNYVATVLLDHLKKKGIKASKKPSKK